PHPFGLLYKDHVQIGIEVLKRIPLFGEPEIARAFDSREIRIHYPHPGPLLLAVSGELAADHGNVGINLVPLLTLPTVLRMSGAVEGVAGTVAADESFPFVDELQQDLLPFRLHGR